MTVLTEGEARDHLEEVEHIVVLMMENRSFDHMLGYLSLPDEQGGRGRGDVDGLSGPDENRNEYEGEPYPITPFGESGLTKVQDPCHSGWCVGQQMAHGMGGFVANYATTRAHQRPGDVMCYQTRDHVPVYDFLASEFAVCDRWFCSVPGSTWPNRLSSLTGEARSKDNPKVPLFDRRSFVHALRDDVSWRWYSSDPGSLRLVDAAYRVGHEHRFAYVEKPSLVQPRTFFTDAMSGSDDFPNVAWVDPNFVDLGGLLGANDDHPPTDAMAGQSLVLKIYQALSQSEIWKRSMLVVTYDEHGGFYDHVDPTDGRLPDEFTRRSEFAHFGPRVPALVISPLVEPGSVFGSQQDDDRRFLFDHTALIKTILLRFGNGTHDGLPDRVGTSSHLGHLLTRASPRPVVEAPRPTIEKVASWWGEQIASRLEYPLATVPALSELGAEEAPGGVQGFLQSVWSVVGRIVDRLPFVRRAPAEPPRAELTEPNELERGIATAAKAIRAQGLRPGQP